METAAKKTGVHRHTPLTHDRLAANGPDAIVLDSRNPHICVHLCISVAKNSAFERQKHLVPKIIHVNPGKSRSKTFSFYALRKSKKDRSPPVFSSFLQFSP
jgi:hypothetical protein